MRTRPLLIPGLLAVTAFAAVTPLPAQLLADPADVAFPPEQLFGSARAVAVTIEFVDPATVQLGSVDVAATPPGESESEPDELLIRLLDGVGNVLLERDAQSPLTVRDWDESGSTESTTVDSTGVSTYYLPLSAALRRVQVYDQDTQALLLDFDVSQEIDAYCQSAPPTPICALFLDSFESTSEF